MRGGPEFSELGADPHLPAGIFSRPFDKLRRGEESQVDACARPAQHRPMTDLLDLLKDQRETGRQMSEDVPKMLADPAITFEQVTTLFKALEEQAGFAEKLSRVLETKGYDPDTVKAAERLEELYVDLAASVAEKVKALRA